MLSIEKAWRSTMLFKKPCRDCGELYRPDGKFQKYCDKCQLERRKWITSEYRCPYKEGKFCTHVSWGNRCTKVRPMCIYKCKSKCPIYNRTKITFEE